MGQDSIYQLLLKNSPAAVYLCDTAGTLLEYNENARSQFQQVMENEPERGANFFDYVPNQHKKGFQENFRKATKGEQVQVIRKQQFDKLRTYKTYYQPIVEDSKVSKVGIYVIDITKEREKLLSDEQRAELAIEGAELGVWNLNLRTGENKVNENWYRMLGYTQDEYEQTYNFFQKKLHPEDRDKINCIFQEFASGQRETVNTEIRLKTKSDTYKWILDRGRVVEKDEDGNPTRIAGTHLDIDSRKRHQQKFEYIAENSTDKIAVWDAKFNCLYVSPSVESLLGYTQQEYKELDNMSLVHPEDKSRLLENISSLGKGEGQNRMSYRYRHKEGHYLWIETTINPFYSKNGDLKEVHTTSRDVTDRVRYHKDLQNEKEFIEKVINSLPGLFYVVDKNQNFVRLNDNFEKELGYSKDEVKNMDLRDFYGDEDLARVQEEFEKVFTEGESSITTRVKRKDGSKGWYYQTGVRFEIDGDEYLLGTSIDISNQIEAEKKLKHQKALLSRLFQNSPIGIAMVNEDNQILEVNESFQEIFGYRKEDIKSNDLDELITTEELQAEQKEILDNQHTGQDSFQYETVRKDIRGNDVPVLIGIIPVMIDEELQVSYLLYIDITERRNYLNKLEKSLKEKKILLQEIHHRVKNNLAVVNSFLQLQKLNSSDSPRLSKILDASMMRIQSMALIHEQLYQSDTFSDIPFKKFINQLADHISQTHDSDDEIELSVNCEDFDLNVNQAIPFALTLNELSSNAFQHAFKGINGTQDKKISINITVEGQQVIGTVEDNGIGIEQSIEELKGSSMGFTIIDTLVKQLHGSLDVETSGGTSVRLVFNKEQIRGSASAFIN